MLKLLYIIFYRRVLSVLFLFSVLLLVGCASFSGGPVALENGEQALEAKGWVKEISSDHKQLVLSRLNKERITLLLTEQTAYARISSAIDIDKGMNLRVLYLGQGGNIALRVEQLPYQGCDKP